MHRLILVALMVTAAVAVGVAMEARAEGLSSGAERLLSANELAAAEMESVRVNFDTAKGSFVVEVYPEIAPLSAENFLRLVGAGFYDGLAVHRVVDGFVMQAGEVAEGQTEKEKLVWEFPDEVNNVHHDPRRRCTSLTPPARRSPSTWAITAGWTRTSPCSGA